MKHLKRVWPLLLCFTLLFAGCKNAGNPMGNKDFLDEEQIIVLKQQYDELLRRNNSERVNQGNASVDFKNLPVIDDKVQVTPVDDDKKLIFIPGKDEDNSGDSVIWDGDSLTSIIINEDHSSPVPTKINFAGAAAENEFLFTYGVGADYNFQRIGGYVSETNIVTSTVLVYSGNLSFKELGNGKISVYYTSYDPVSKKTDGKFKNVEIGTLEYYDTQIEGYCLNFMTKKGLPEDLNKRISE